MDVFVLMVRYDYEGTELVGIYGSLEEAIAGADLYASHDDVSADSMFVEKRAMGDARFEHVFQKPVWECDL